MGRFGTSASLLVARTRTLKGLMFEGIWAQRPDYFDARWKEHVIPALNPKP